MSKSTVTRYSQWIQGYSPRFRITILTDATSGAKAITRREFDSPIDALEFERSRLKGTELASITERTVDISREESTGLLREADGNVWARIQGPCTWATGQREAFEGVVEQVFGREVADRLLARPAFGRSPALEPEVEKAIRGREVEQIRTAALSPAIPARQTFASLEAVDAEEVSHALRTVVGKLSAASFDLDSALRARRLSAAGYRNPPASTGREREHFGVSDAHIRNCLTQAKDLLKRLGDAGIE